MSVFSERLQELKMKRNIMQKDVAEAIGVPLRTYQRYEYGEREPQLSTLIRMADFYGVSLDYLAGRTDKE
ncbi:MAG: helix-turn-helix transcriptional regulator [Oscillospiraceae bacterium]|nr:helix-turn-helix transcriptional regulator [Oscillospiraceae bacterium]